MNKQKPITCFKPLAKGAAIQIIRSELAKEGINPTGEAVQTAMKQATRPEGFVLHTHAVLSYNGRARRYYITGYAADQSDVQPFLDRRMVALRSAAADEAGKQSLTFRQRMFLMLDAVTDDVQAVAFTFEELIKHVEYLATGDAEADRARQEWDAKTENVTDLYGRSMDSELAAKTWYALVDAIHDQWIANYEQSKER